jgi:uncharacterized protein (TIGR01777 family)
MRIAVTGASGFIGSHLGTTLQTQGHEVLALVRHEPGNGEIRWDPEAGTVEAGKLERIDGAVHLAGENIATRWTDDARRKIRESRVKGTGLLARTLAGLSRKPAVLVSISAVGYYGDRGEEILTESSGPGAGFLATVAREWEAAAQPARDAGIRVVHPRMGVVLDGGGGALTKMLAPFKAGIGGKVSSGEQWMSWIALEDAVAAMIFLLTNQTLAGPVNFTAPEPVRNEEFTRVLAQELHRPALLTVPKLALYLLYGKDMVDETLIASTRVLPEALVHAGFRFQYPGLRPALARALDH